MTDLIPTAKNFALDIASDAVNFPKTSASWPVFKQALVEFYKEIKSDLFSFQKDTRLPVVTEATAKLGEIFKKENTTGKVDELLQVKAAARDKLNAVKDNQAKKQGWSFGLMFPAMLIGGLTLGPGGLLASMFVLGGASLKFMDNSEKASRDRATIVEKVNAEVQKIDPVVVFAAPEAQKVLVDRGVLKNAFEAKKSWLNGDPQENYDDFLKKLPKPAPAVVAAAPQTPVVGA